MDEVATKTLWKSKTFKVAILQIIIGIIVFVQGEVAIGSAVTGKGILDIVLRLLTKEGVKVFGE